MTVHDEQGQDLHSLVQEYKDWWNAEGQRLDESQKVANTLYHYTDAAGLKGIIETRQIWFGGVLHLNDPTELSEGLGIAIAHIEAVLATATTRAARTLCLGIKRVLEHELGKVFGFFVASFSHDGDDLGQWRAYGNNGRGFAVGLSPRVFRPIKKESYSLQEAFIVSPVTYDAAELERRQKEAVDRALELAQRAEVRGFFKSDDAFAYFMADLSTQAAGPILISSIAFKHSAYRSEAETRLILINSIEKLSGVVETRVRGADLVTDVKGELAFEPQDVETIVVGPAAAPDAEDAVQFLLLKNGIPPSGKISRSNVPYRP